VRAKRRRRHELIAYFQKRPPTALNHDETALDPTSPVEHRFIDELEGLHKKHGTVDRYASGTDTSGQDKENRQHFRVVRDDSDEPT